MLDILKAALPTATHVESYDYGVWLEFDYEGAEYQLFDEWAFGNPVPENHAARYWLARYAVSREAAIESDSGPEHWLEVGKFASPVEAFEAIKGA